jgi:hypothetical protein
MVTAAQAKKYGWNEKEKTLIKNIDSDNFGDALYGLEMDPNQDFIDQVINEHNLKSRLEFTVNIWERLTFPFTFHGDYAGYSTIAELKELIAKQEAKGVTHIDSEELTFVKVKELTEDEVYLLKSLLKKFVEYHKVSHDKLLAKQKTSQLAQAKKDLAQKKKEIIELEKIIANET